MTKYKGYYNRAGTMSSYEATEDGGLLVHGVIIMAAGSWTDMHGIATTFTEEVLERCASQWADNAVWTRHAGGTPRAVTEKVGAVLNPHYSPPDGAVVGDVYLHNQTDASRACSSLVQMAREDGGIKDVSAETIVDLDRDGLVLDVTFTGLALVEDGACETCRLPAFGKEDNAMTDDNEVKTETEVKTSFEGEDGADPQPAEKETDDLLELLAHFIGEMIPDTKPLIEEAMGAEGEERIRALGKIEGCMQTFGIPTVAEAYSKAMDEKLTAFGASIDEKLKDLQNQVAQYSSTPDGVKGRGGADKEVAEERQTITFYGRGRTALY